MKQLFLGLTIIFCILTFCGAGYILYTGGEANGGYGAVPMVAAVAFLALYRSKKNKKE